MAAKKKTKTARRVEAQIGLDAISIEGALLSPSWLGRIAQQAAPGQTDSDYSVPKGLSLRDEIGRYWRIAQAYWAEFARGQAGGGDGSALARRLILGLLKECFGFSTIVAVDDLVVDERSYPIGQSALGGRVPIVIAAAGIGLDTPEPTFGEDGRRRTAFGLVQEYLNAEDLALWGLVTDGVTLRIVRDNASLTRPAWIEADLARIFNEERHPDFTALWLLIHESRFGRTDQPVTECPLEAWRNAGQEEGTRARDHLRDGVEEALLVLGRGFLSHPENRALRNALQDGILSTREYFNQLLRLIYRLIFLLTVEERGLLHADGDDKAKALYAEGYSLRRLRDRSVKRSAHDRFSDAWEGVKIVIRGVAQGEPRLALPALAGIFASKQCPDLDGARLENHVLLLAMFRLSWLRDDGALARVNWRDMGPEELGSVYESLLELVPKITKDGREFGWAQGAETKGNARKTSGSYYTPDSLVQVLLDSALEPVIADTIARNPEQSIEALLSLSIVDPACGSGHFLLAAARRLAGHVARLQANGTPSAAEYRHALRQVVSRCIYGVDLNPMAVELCKVSLWMEAVEPGLPLTFLDSHVQCGNSLLGTTPELMAKGIPDAAWDPIEGDDKKTASALKKRNKQAAEGQRSFDTLWSTPSDAEAQTVARAVAELEAASDADPEALTKKESRWDGILSSSEYQHQKFVADAWCATFMWPKHPGQPADAAPTNELWRQLRDAQGQPSTLTMKTVSELNDQYRFFHWHLQFPQVFAKGGFDVVLGNPPWDTLSPDAKEFFSVYDEGIRFQSKNEQETTIARLLEDPVVSAAWVQYRRSIFASATFMKESGRFSLFAPGNLGKGDFNLYRIFVELALRIVREGGWAAQVVPDGLYAGANSMALRRELFEHFRLDMLFGFENAREFWFPGVDSRAKFTLYSAHKGGNTDTFTAAFWIRSSEGLQSAIRGETALRLPVSMVREFSPDALAVMEFRGQLDIDIARKMYACFPPLGQVVAGTAHRSYLRELESGHVQNLLTEDPNHLPHYEGRMVAQYDHRAKGYRSGRARAAVWEDLPFGSPAKSIQPQWYVRPEAAPAQAKLRMGEYRVGFCDVASPTNERTLVATVLPRNCIAGDKVPTLVMRSETPRADLLVWLAAANSFVFDFLVRMKVSLKMALTVLDSLPFPRLSAEDPVARFLIPRVLRLVCTGVEMNALWDEMAIAGFVDERADDPTPPGISDPDERLQLVAEIEAQVALLYGLTAVELEHILDTFPIVHKNDMKAHAEYRTRNVILKTYDAMEKAARTGQPYQKGRDPLPIMGMPDLASVPAGGWMRPHAHERGEIQATILAVLKAHGGPMDRREARLAILLCLEPHLLTPQLSTTERANWVRAVGPDAQKKASSSIDGTTQEWGGALSGLRGRGRLVDDREHNTWALGTGTDAIKTSGWPEFRARFVVGVLLRLQASTRVDAVILKFPTAVREWLEHAA